MGSLKVYIACVLMLVIGAVALLPDPTMQPRKCGHSTDKPSRICDPDLLLSSAAKQRIDKLLEDIEVLFYFIRYRFIIDCR